MPGTIFTHPARILTVAIGQGADTMASAVARTVIGTKHARELRPAVAGLIKRLEELGLEAGTDFEIDYATGEPKTLEKLVQAAIDEHKPDAIFATSPIAEGVARSVAQDIPIMRPVFTRRTDLTMFLVTAEKAYLCRKSRFECYASFVLELIISRMAERGIDDACLARTDDTPEYGAFHLRQKENGETDDLYGAAIYGPYYQIKSHAPRRSLVSWARGRLSRYVNRVYRIASRGEA
jgi:hypothetical protein